MDYSDSIIKDPSIISTQKANNKLSHCLTTFYRIEQLDLNESCTTIFTRFKVFFPKMFVALQITNPMFCLTLLITDDEKIDIIHQIFLPL